MIDFNKALEIANQFLTEDEELNSYENTEYAEFPGAFVFFNAPKQMEDEEITEDGYVLIVNKDNGVVTKKFILDFFEMYPGGNENIRPIKKEESKEYLDGLFGV